MHENNQEVKGQKSKRAEWISRYGSRSVTVLLVIAIVLASLALYKRSHARWFHVKGLPIARWLLQKRQAFRQGSQRTDR